MTIALSGYAAGDRRVSISQSTHRYSGGLAAGLATGLLCGIVNGLLITKLQMPAFIVTLGMLGIALGLGQLLSGGTSVPNVPPDIQTQIGLREFLRSTSPVSGFASLRRLSSPTGLRIAAVVLNRTRFGRYTFAIGSNAAASRGPE